MTLNQPPSFHGRPLGAVLFDLDGTLLDTLADIASALNQALAEENLAPMAENDVVHMIGRGSPVLIERAAAARGASLNDAQRAAMLDAFVRHYAADEQSGRSSARPYPGVAEVLEYLRGNGIYIAVVTNKQWSFAGALLRRLGLMHWVNVVVGDTCARRKPDPEPLLFACSKLNIDPSRALMVGDSINDVRAARAAHMPVVCVPYGYNEGEDPRLLPCDAIIETLADLPALLHASAAFPAAHE